MFSLCDPSTVPEEYNGQSKMWKGRMEELVGKIKVLFLNNECLYLRNVNQTPWLLENVNQSRYLMNRFFLSSNYCAKPPNAQDEGKFFDSPFLRNQSSAPAPSLRFLEYKNGH